MNELIYLKSGGNIGLSNPITDGLVLNLDASIPSSYPGTGTLWYDLSSSSNKVNINGPTFSTDNGGNFSFITNDYGCLSGTTLDTPSAQTISVWCYSTTYNQDGFIFEKTTNGSVNTQYSLWIANGNFLYYRTYGLSTVDLVISGMDSYINTWINIVATFDGTYKRVYINDTLKGTSSALTGTITSNNTGNAIIGALGGGAWVAGGYYFNGKLSNIQIFNRSLSSVEISKNYISRGKQTVGFFQPYSVNANTKGYYQFNNNLIDLSGNNYNGSSGSTTSYITGILQSNALKLSGITSVATMSNPVIPSGCKTISLWIYELGTSVNYSSVLSNSAVFGGAVTGTTIYYTSDANWINWNFQIRGGSADGDTYGLYTTSAYIARASVPAWIHLVFQWDGTLNAGGIGVYLNGVRQRNLTMSKLEATNTNNMKVGQSSTNTQEAYFYIDELIIENRFWSQQEVTDYYNKIKLHL